MGKEIEKAKETEITETEIKKRFANLILEFYRDFFGTDEITPRMIAKESSINTWYGCMRYIHEKYISAMKLKEFNRLSNGRMNGGWRYDTDVVEIIANVYLDFCKVYNKPPSARVFSGLTGIGEDTLQIWKNGGIEDELTERRIKIFKKISGERRESIIGRVLDGGAATIGAVTMYNNEILGNSAMVADSGMISGRDLPRLGVSDD